MVEHFSDLTYVQIMRSTTQEGNVLLKLAFETWAATFGVKINRYYEYNSIFSEQHFRSTIEESNRKIKFCGVGSNYQNAIAEIKNQILFVGDITLLMHAKIYWTE